MKPTLLPFATRLNDIQIFPEKELEHILYTIDALIKNAKLKSISE
ncbi:hypothetical protein [Ohtaekwangia koreensis]|nr:hypothetical protein [Ohtaekwangia koreensis]